MATRDQIQYLVAKNKASSMNTIEQDEELPEHPPAHLNRNQKAVVRYILAQLQRDLTLTFNSAAIAQAVELSSKTVQRTLKLLQREGYLRLHKLQNGFVRYTYHQHPAGASLTVYDGVESLLDTFPAEAVEKPEPAKERFYPLFKAEALGVADLRGLNKAIATELWKDFQRQECGLGTADNWTRFLNEQMDAWAVSVA